MVALNHRIVEPNAESGFSRFLTLVKQEVTPIAFMRRLLPAFATA